MLTALSIFIRPAHLHDFAMHSFEPELALRLINERQTTNRNRRK